jgi:tRNA pseudouridine13 synthase
MKAAIIRSVPEDFVVTELPAYAANGRGEHLWVTFTKRSLSTPQALDAIARELDVDARGVGYAGMKDRHAVTTQSATFPLPLARDAATAVAKLEAVFADPARGITIHAGSMRHEAKLKPGHLHGNRFSIALRGLSGDDAESVRARFAVIAEQGVPNAFGEQRFGRDGDNPERALAWLAGKERGPRDRRMQRLLFSSLQSLLFNRVLARRVEAGSWLKVLPGDLAKKNDSGGLFDVPLEEGAERDDAIARGDAGLVSATGPMFGVKMRWPKGEPAEIERAVLAEAIGDAALLEANRHLGEGTRRSLRLPVAGVRVDDEPDRDALARGLRVEFVLPKGGYATTVLAAACAITQAPTPARAEDDTQAEASDD